MNVSTLVATILMMEVPILTSTLVAMMEVPIITTVLDRRIGHPR